MQYNMAKPASFYDSECVAALPVRSDPQASDSDEGSSSYLKQKVEQLHLVLKIYFSPIEQEHVVYLLNLYRYVTTEQIVYGDATCNVFEWSR